MSKLSKNGFLTIYEGGDKSVERITKNINLNGFEKYNIIHGVVGQNIDVYGGSTNLAIKVLPEDLAECDYLELDCEGSEKSILESMFIRPKYITIEIHPFLISKSIDWLYDFILKNDYIVAFFSGHDGVLLSESEFKFLYNHNLSTGEKRHKNLLGRAPMVICLTKN